MGSRGGCNVNDAQIVWGPLSPDQIAEMYPLRFTVVYAAPTEELAEQAWEALSGVKGLTIQ